MFISFSRPMQFKHSTQITYPKLCYKQLAINGKKRNITNKLNSCPFSPVSRLLRLLHSSHLPVYQRPLGLFSLWECQQYLYRMLSKSGL
jgi:hypothetical protein